MVETQKVAAGQRITVGDVTIVPIVRTAASCQRGHHGTFGFGGKDVIAVVVLSAGRPRAVTVDGEETPVEEYAGQVSEIAALLQGR